jgi:phosphomannomutase
MVNVVPDQLEFVKNYLDMKVLKDAKFRILVDSMYGAGNRYIEELLKGTGCTVKTIHAERDINFGGVNPEPIEMNLGEMLKVTKDERFDIGLATDGDVDRIGCSMPDGAFMDAQIIMSLLLWHFVQDRKMKGSVITTICGTELLKNICRKYKLLLRVTPVGFKYICDYMRKEDVLIGGEEAGGIGFKDYIPERDGILSGLLLVEMMAYRKKPILEIFRDMEREFGTYRYLKTSIRVTEDIKRKLMPDLEKNPLKKILDRSVKRVDMLDGIKFECDDKSWLLFRLSGTEPILRIYAEAGSVEKASEILEFGKEVATKR